jgi:DNA-binding NtrC family response regulator
MNLIHHRSHGGAASRGLLCVNPDESCLEAFAALRAAGWEPHPVHRPEQMRRLIEDAQFKVGVVRIGPDVPAGDPPYLTDVMRGGKTEWIALLPPKAIDAAQVRRVVADYFFDFHTLPLDISRMLTTLGHAYGMASLKQSEPAEPRGTAAEMVGCSRVMMSLFRAIRKIAATDAPVLITGESGTGKELTARAIHERSHRGSGPFVVINCGAIPANLIQSELFGYEKGAFTGATQRKIGRIEAASKGTIFLDEIGDLPLDLQINLLRFLQERQIDRVGGTEPISVDVRVIAATNAAIERAVAEGRFRGDLYHRLNVLSLTVPALRERDGDVPVLARFFFDHFEHERRRSVRGFSHTAVEAMTRHDWPGNVRELINRVRRAMVMCEGRMIGPGDLELAAERDESRVPTLPEVRAHAERDAIHDALVRHGYMLACAARELGVSRVTLYRLSQKYGLKLPRVPV